MPHFFIDSNSVAEGHITISNKNDYTHIARSLRAKIGEKLLLIDENQIQYETEIKEITSSSIITTISKSYKSSRNLGFNLYLAQTPLKSDSQTLVVEKATELGVKGLYPIYTDNCAVNKNVIIKKIPKWQKTMAEASKQCERADIPTCFDLTTIDKLTDFNRVIAFCEHQCEQSLKNYLLENPIKLDENILIIIGPEGGFSKREFDYFKDNNISMLTLGDLILKAETAVIVALGNLIYEFER